MFKNLRSKSSYDISEKWDEYNTTINIENVEIPKIRATLVPTKVSVGCINGAGGRKTRIRTKFESNLNRY